MGKRIGGARKKSRHIMKKSRCDKGKISITRYFQELKIGDKVALKAEPAYQKGMYNLRFHGKIGTVAGREGKCYKVKIIDGKAKMLTVHPVHLRKV